MTRGVRVVLFGAALVSATAFASKTPTMHPVHFSYGRLTVEGRTLTLRLRLFRDDIAQALATFGSVPVRMASNAHTDALFASYFNERAFVATDGARLRGVVVASGEDAEMWWYDVRFTATRDVRTLRVRNGVLFDLYADQSNIVKVVHFPSERQFALSFAARDTEPQTVAFTSR